MIETTTDIECQNKPMSLTEKQDQRRGVFCASFCAACSIATLFLFLVFIQSFSRTISIICFWFVVADLFVFLAAYRNIINVIKLINIVDHSLYLEILMIHVITLTFGLPFGIIALVEQGLFPTDMGLICFISLAETCLIISVVFAFLTRRHHLQLFLLILSYKKVFAACGFFSLFISCILGSVAAFGDTSKQDKNGLMITFYVFLSIAGVFIALGVEYIIEMAREHFCEES